MLNTIYGESGTGKTSLLASYCGPMLIFTPDKSRIAATLKRYGRRPFHKENNRNGDILIEVNDAEDLLMELQKTRVDKYPGIVVVEDYSVLCSNLLDLITAPGEDSESAAPEKAKTDHWGYLSRVSNACMNRLKVRRRSLIVTHPTNKKDDFVPGAGSINSSLQLAKISANVLYLARVEPDSEDPIQAFTSRVVAEGDNYAWKYTEIGYGIHAPYLPRILPDFCPEKNPVLNESLIRLGQKMIHASRSDRNKLAARALQKYSKELVHLAFQSQLWASQKQQFSF